MKKHPIDSIFWGRLKVQRLDSLFHYRKNTPIQTILHRIKYHHYPELAEEVGRYYGKYLRSSGNYSHITAIVPIPLHPSKLEKRGYNQAEEFAKGLAETMQLKLSSKILKKSTQTTTQTKKNRNERAQELSDSFEVFWSKKSKNPHFLLVDDVITTGATLEAAGKKLLEIPGARLSMVSLAVVI
jgi:ComF family protein